MYLDRKNAIDETTATFTGKLVVCNDPLLSFGSKRDKARSVQSICMARNIGLKMSSFLAWEHPHLSEFAENFGGEATSAREKVTAAKIFPKLAQGDIFVGGITPK